MEHLDSLIVADLVKSPYFPLERLYLQLLLHDVEVRCGGQHHHVEALLLEPERYVVVEIGGGNPVGAENQGVNKDSVTHGENLWNKEEGGKIQINDSVLC